MNSKKNIIDNKIERYDHQQTDIGPLSVNDIVSDKYNVIHKRLYNNALEKYLAVLAEKKETTVEEIRNGYKMIEIKGSEWHKPSTVKLIQKKYPHEMISKNLSDYWEHYQYDNDSKDIKDLPIDEDSKMDAKIIFYDFVNARVKMKSNYTSKEYWVPFEYVNSYTMISKDDMTLSSTFNYLRNQIKKQ